MTPFVLKKLIKRLADQGRVLVYGGPHHSSVLVASQFQSVNFSEVKDLRFESGLEGHIVGFLNYEDMVAQKFDSSRFYKIEEGILFSSEEESYEIIGSFDSRIIEDLELESAESEELIPTNSPITLLPLESNHHYLESCTKALNWIREGRFYQINLLRFFEVLGLNRQCFVDHWLDHSGPYGALLIDQEHEIFSYSPEQFVVISTQSHRKLIQTFPIKGTRKRSSDPKMDLDLKAELEKSSKDRAELSMIIDLMRHDLYQVTKKGSIRVDDPGQVRSFPTVHHLIASVSGELRDDLSLGQLFSIYPAGSITGAPKKEVTSGIRELEQRNRDFFMGSAFHLSPSGAFHSTVMIRTAQKIVRQYQYAAGSGIVVKSVPEDEMAEIFIKCRVLTGDQDELIIKPIE
jgi:anthranilate/para-aminobenzoate synthase component I